MAALRVRVDAAHCNGHRHSSETDLLSCPSSSDSGTGIASSMPLNPTNGTSQAGNTTIESNITSSIMATGVNSTAPSSSLFSMNFHTVDVRTSSVDSAPSTHPVDELNTSRTTPIPSSHSSPTTHSTISSSSSRQTPSSHLTTTTSAQTSSLPASLPSPSSSSTSHPEPSRTHEVSRHSDVAIISASVGAPFGVFLMLLLVLVLRKCRKRPANHGEPNTSDPSEAHAPQSEPSLPEATSETATLNSTARTSGKRFSAARMSSRPIVHIAFPSSTATLVDAPPSPLEPNRRPPSPLPPSPRESVDTEAELPATPDGDISPTSDDVSEVHRETDAGSLPYPLREEQIFASAAGLPPAYEDLPPRRLAPNRLQDERDD